VRSEKAHNAGHPDVETLALYSKGDVAWVRRCQIGRHVGRCADCEEQVLQFRSAGDELKREANRQTLTAFEATTDWARLEREMLGNIGVGVAAARCIEKVGRRRILRTPGVWVTVIPRRLVDQCSQSTEGSSNGIAAAIDRNRGSPACWERGANNARRHCGPRSRRDADHTSSTFSCDIAGGQFFARRAIRGRRDRRGHDHERIWRVARDERGCHLRWALWYPRACSQRTRAGAGWTLNFLTTPRCYSSRSVSDLLQLVSFALRWRWICIRRFS
jgi:hypothetical protein